MKFLYPLVLLFTCQFLYAQPYSVQINSGNHEAIIGSFYDRERNELIALDKLGFIVRWNLNNFSIISKFQLPPDGPYSTTKKDMLGKYEIKAFDSIITVTYPFNYYNYTKGERLVDLYKRNTGAFIMQTPFGKISSVAYAKDGSVITASATTNKQGYLELFEEAVLTKVNINKKQFSVNLDEVPVSMEVDNKTNKLALGYRYGKVEIRDLKSLQLISSFNHLAKAQEKKITQLLFIPGSNKLAYNAEHSGSIMVADIQSGSLIDSMQLSDTDYRLAVSPSGKYLTALDEDFYYVFWHDLQKRTTEQKFILDSRKVPGLFLSEVFFLNDDMLVGTGRNSLVSQNIKVSGMGNVGAWLGMIDVKNNISSANLNVITASSWIESFGTQMLKQSSLSTVMHGFKDEYAFTDPLKLQVRSGKLTELSQQFSMYVSNREQREIQLTDLQRVGSSSAPDLGNTSVSGTLFNMRGSKDADTCYIAYYNIAADSFLKATRLVLPQKEVATYDMQGVLYKEGLSFFVHHLKNANDRHATELLVYNAEGKIVFSDTVLRNFSYKTITVSPHQQYFAYQPQAGKLVIRSLKDYSVIHSINTGFSSMYSNVTGYANPKFIPAKPNVLLHEAYRKEGNNPWFCLLSTDVVAKTTDTVINFSLRPVNYDTDSTGSTLTLVYNYDFTDSAFTNEKVVMDAAMQAFKPLFKPTVLLYDVKTKDFAGTVHTGQAGVSSATINDGWVTALQNDGQVLHFNTNNKNSKIAQVMDGNNLALVADTFYYASPALLSLIKFKTNKGAFAAAQADVFLNRPHDILQLLTASKQTELIKPYQQAFQKRLAQHSANAQLLNTLLQADANITMQGRQQQSLYSAERKVELPFIISDKANITNIRVLLNGHPVFGRRGVDVKKVLADKKVLLDLNAGENYITITAETSNGKQLEPVKYFYHYEPKVYKAPKLFFFSAGVSNYKDSTYNLKYAAKDAKDIFQAFRYKVADTIISEILLDKDVTTKNINAWAKQIEKAGIDDIVILYFAGHGLLDANNDFYYAVHDIDFEQPKKNGLSYEAILNLLDKSLSRKKILLLDACHSGSFDKSQAKKIVQSSSTGNVAVVSNEKRAKVINATQGYSESQAFVLMNQVFTDLSSDIGIDVVAASLGNSYALEKESLQNGLFTYAMIRAVALSMAAGKGGETETITMDQVKRYVEKEVRRLSNNEQVPSIRSSNVHSGMIEFYYSWKNADEAFEQFVERYK